MMTLTPFDQVVNELVRRGVPREKAERAAQNYSVCAIHGVVGEHLPVAVPRDGMNTLERRRSLELEIKRRAGEIRSWTFGSVTLLLADRCRYTPDFLVEHIDRRLELEEVKGHWRDDARVKIKVAAELYPMFTFTALRPRRKAAGGGWDVEAFHSRRVT